MVSPQRLVHVFYHGLGDQQAVGRLLLKDRQIFFEYDSAFIQHGLELSPFKLPLGNQIVCSNDKVFGGLFGVFNDSLPDGWGRFLLDRKLMGMGLNPGSFSPLDRLCFVGASGMGALSYEPEHRSSPASTSWSNGLDEIYREIRHDQKYENEKYIDHLLILGGSSAGVRPKVLLRIENEDWLIKFRSSMDPSDMACIEYAYHLMAIEAGLDVPSAKLFPSRKSRGFFGTKRFDRCGHRRVHMHTISGLLHADHTEPSLDYEALMKATLYLARDMRECKKQFRNCVFNVLSHNRDDHSKNFSFLMDAHGVWRLSPSYDLTFSFGPGGEHSTTVMGEGKNPTIGHLLGLAHVGNIQKHEALETIDQVRSAIKKWEIFANQAGVSRLQTKNIGRVLERLNSSAAS